MNSHADKIARLRAGEIVEHVESGDSMTPVLMSRQPVKLKYLDPSTICKGDVVWCKVRGSLMTHLVTGREGKGEKLRLQISNNHGWVNGWAKAKDIYGKVVEVQKGGVWIKFRGGE